MYTSHCKNTQESTSLLRRSRAATDRLDPVPEPKAASAWPETYALHRAENYGWPDRGPGQLANVCEREGERRREINCGAVGRWKRRIFTSMEIRFSHSLEDFATKCVIEFWGWVRSSNKSISCLVNIGAFGIFIFYNARIHENIKMFK